MTAQKIVEELLKLQNNYAFTYRAMVTPERLSHYIKNSEAIDVESERMREPLLEHVGHLPIVASFLHPRIEHSEEVNLGRSLIMLSVHDIGETVVGDIMTYKKNSADTKLEYESALKILPAELIPYYNEFEEGDSLDAKFARAVDALAPFLHEIIAPNLTRKRFEVHAFNSEKIEKKKRSLFEWDSKLLEIFNLILETFYKIEQNEPTGFESRIDI